MVTWEHYPLRALCASTLPALRTFSPPCLQRCYLYNTDIEKKKKKKGKGQRYEDMTISVNKNLLVPSNTKYWETLPLKFKHRSQFTIKNVLLWESNLSLLTPARAWWWGKCLPCEQSSLGEVGCHICREVYRPIRSTPGLLSQEICMLTFV